MSDSSKKNLQVRLKMHGKWLGGAGAADLRMDLHGETHRGVRLRGANLTDAIMVGTDLSDANLFGGNLAGVDFTAATLTRAKLRGAILRTAKLIRADLRGADLRDADLGGADLTEAILTGALINAATCFGGAKLDRAVDLPPEMTRSLAEHPPSTESTSDTIEIEVARAKGLRHIVDSTAFLSRRKGPTR